MPVRTSYLASAIAEMCPGPERAQLSNYLTTESVLPEEITNEITTRSHHCGADKVRIQELLFSADVL